MGMQLAEMDVQALARLSSTGTVLVLQLLLQHAILSAGMEKSEDLNNVMIKICNQMMVAQVVVKLSRIFLVQENRQIVFLHQHAETE